MEWISIYKFMPPRGCDNQIIAAVRLYNLDITDELRCENKKKIDQTCLISVKFFWIGFPDMDGFSDKYEIKLTTDNVSKVKIQCSDEEHKNEYVSNFQVDEYIKQPKQKFSIQDIVYWQRLNEPKETE
jgi:hypothetical protein